MLPLPNPNPSPNPNPNPNPNPDPNPTPTPTPTLEQVLSAAGQPIGAITLANKLASQPAPTGTESAPRPFETHDERCLALLCSLLGPALERQMLRDDDFYRR